MPDSRGSLHEATLYDLEVFNKLAMTFIDNPRAVEIRNKFNDVIIKAEILSALNFLSLRYKKVKALRISKRTATLFNSIMHHFTLSPRWCNL
jgi:hypothetical protein